MTAYTKYKTATGRITMNLSVNDIDIAVNTAGDETAALGTYDNDLYYFIDGSPPLPTLKTVNTVALDKTTIVGDGVDGATFSTVPNPSTVKLLTSKIQGRPIEQSISVTDGTLTITAQSKGTINIIVDSGLMITQQTFSIKVT